MLNYEFPPLGGGASPVSYEIARRYVKLGHRIDVITMGFKNLPKFEVKDGINVYRIKCWRKKIEICTTPEMFTYIISAKHFLKKHIRKNRYDINHTHFIIPTGIVSLWVKKRFRLNYIITSHGSDVLEYNKRFDKIYPFVSRIWRKVVKNANCIVTPTKFLQEEIRKQIKDYNNFKVIHHGIDLDEIEPHKKEKYILICSRLFINKGIQDFLEAIKDLNLMEWTIKIAGEGPYKRELISLKNKYNLKDKVDFLGWIDNKSRYYKELFNHASIFICPSWFESMGITLMESMVAGCAIIATNTTGCPEVVGDAALLVRPKNPRDIHWALQRLIGNYKLRNKLGLKARKKAEEKFPWKNIIKKYEEVLINESKRKR